MIGTTLAHYHITAALGAGGMGEVWRATDEKLGRDVALKVLSEEFASDPQRLDRFEREARAVAALNHPHIVTIFSVEEAEGIRFLTMELIEGRSLDKLIPEGGLEIGRFFELATPLAEAISAAHDKSVIHRDLKPSNVMVDGDGRVKVLDFGLAKLQQPGDVSDSTQLPTEALTGIGVIVGTVPYMSPEQVEGKIVDHRTDVFSLGVLLYEMATGERPFQGESSVGLMSSILRDSPAPVGERRDDLPNHLGRIISRCLEKDRRDRYQTARDVFNELKALWRESTSTAARVSTSMAVPQRAAPQSSSSSAEVLRRDVPWIAMLPFSCPSGDPEVEAFSDGLEEDIATGLSRFSYLFVVARKSTRRFRGEAVDVREVGEELGARYVMEGGIRKAGSTIRINVQIVDAETGTHLWAETYDRDLDETAIFTVQDDITDRVVATVADPYGVVARSMAIPTGAIKPQEMSAYQAVLRYFLYQQRLSQEDHVIAREALERAVEIEPGYADAWSCLALIVLDEDRHDFNRRPDALDRALSAARRGVEADPASSFAHYALATVHFYRRDLGAFRANAETAIKLNRRNGNVVAMLGVLYGYSGDWDRGVELTTEAMELNPHHPGWYRFTTFFDHYLKGEYEEALKIAQKINMPGYYGAPMVELLAHKRLGNTAAAENAAREMLLAYPAEDMREYGRFAKMWFYSQPDLLNEVISVLRSVGVRVDAPDGEVSTPAPASSPSTRAASQIAAATETQRVAIAVLPFVNMSEDPGNEFFSDGVTEEILNNLSKIRGLHVISRTSATSYKGTSKSIREIASELGVGSMLEGSVRRAGDRVRVTAKLIEAATDKHLWSESYDRDLEDIFEVQSEVAVEIARALEAELVPEVVAQIRKRPTEDMKAYDLYLQGRQGARTLRAPEILRGIGQLEEAISLDPDFASAHAELALAHLRSAYWGAVRGRDDFDDARKAANRALELDPANSIALVARAGVRSLSEFDWDGAVDDLNEAIRLGPNEAEAHHWLGMTLFLMERFDEAAAAHEVALSLDPHSPNVASHLGLSLYFSGQQEEGRRLLRDGIDQHPVFFDFPNFMAITLKQENRFKEAADWFVRSFELAGQHPLFEALHASSLRLAGNKTGARTVIDRLKTSDDDPRVDSIVRAAVAAAESDVEAVLQHLHEAADQRLPLVYWLRFALQDSELPPDHPGVRALWSRIWPDAPAAGAGQARVRQTPLVGRDSERETLDRMLEDAVRGRGSLVLLGGEPGVGKTRLASEILEDGRERGMLALAGHAYEDETAPFVTSSEILEEMVRLVPAIDLRRMLGDNASELARLLPELRTIFSDISEPADVPPEMLQRHLFKNVLEFLTRGSAEQPMVMLFDDIHWADESSLLLLEHIAPRLAELPILMIGTHRDVEADIGKPFSRSMATLARQRLAERMTVKPFDEGSVADILTALGGSEAPKGLTHAIHEATEGNVFFIEETFRHLTDEGLLFDEDGDWKRDIDVEHLDVPEGVRLVTARRLERLSEPTRTVLSLASVIGLRFTVSVLEAAAPDADAVLDALEEAEAAQLLKPAAGDRDLRYEFVHALARQTLLGELSPLRQQRMHLTIADAIERTAGSEPERRAADIAHHLVEAGSSADPERVVRWLMAAGENAVAATAMEEAVDIFDKALSIAGNANQDLRAQLLRLRGPARLGLGDSEGFQADLFEAFTIYESRQRGEVAAETASELAYILIWTAQSDRAHEVVTRALDLIGEAESRERCRLLSAQGLAHSMGREPGDPGAAKRCHEAAVEMARQVGDPRLLAEALQNQAMGFWHRLEGGGRHPAHEAASIQREAKREWSLGNCLWLEKASFTLGGLFEEAAAIDEELRPLAERNANFGALGIMELMNSTIRRASGDLEGSSQALRRSKEHFEAGGFPWGSFQDGYEAVSLLLRGKNEEARRALDTLGANFMEGAVYTGVDTAYWLSGKAHLGDSDILEQYRNYHSYVPERGRAMTAGALVFLKGSIEALVLAGERDEAAKLYPLIADFVQSNLGLFDFAFGLHERFAGMAAAAGRDWETADRHFKNALELAETLPHRVDQARVRYWYARMLLDRGGSGDVERAKELLAIARELGEEMGLRGLLQWIGALDTDGKAAGLPIPSGVRRRIFVGRDDERAALDQMLDEAAAGRGGLVLLGGEPGVGKTRLATEVLDDGRERGMLALAGHAYEDETAPFVTASEILEEMVRLLPPGDLRRMLGDNASELARLLPELRTIFSDIPEPADVPPEMLQRHLFKNVLEFLTHAAGERPMVMLLDDIHWADESSLLLLEHIAPRLAELPILMIGTYRDVEADIGKPFARSMATLVRQRQAERFHIDPFDETSVAEILAALGGSDPPPELAHAIHEATEGNVFFIEETFRHLSDEGLLFDEDGDWKRDIDVEHLDVPEGVRLVTARRLERLSEPTQKILSLASVIGLRFPVEVLEAAAENSEAVVDAVEEAEAAHLLQPATGGHALRYEFVHALARQTLLSELSAIRRQRMHLVIADAIEKIHGEHAERSASDLAYHLVESGASADSKRTVRWLTAAGENAGAAAAVEEAVQYFDRALSLLGGEQAEVRSGLLHRRGSARLRLGQRDECTADLTEAFDGFESLGQGEQAAAVASELSYILVTYARPSDAKALIARALALIGGEDSVARCELLSAQGLAHGMASEPSAAERIHEAAIPMARTLARPALLAKVLENQSIDRWHVLDGVTAERSAHEAASIRRDLRQEWNLGQCLWREKTGLVLQGRYDEAERIDEELHPLARRNDDVLSLALSALMNGVIQQARGNIAESSRQLRLSIELFDAGGFPWGPLNEGYDSVNALLTGEFDSARAGFDRAVAHRLPANCWSGAEDCYQLSGKARLGDPDTYRLFESLRPKIPLAGETVPAGTAFLLLGAIEALVLIGRADEAATLYPAIRSFVSSGISVQSFTYGLHERFAGMAAAAASNWEAAEWHFDKALHLAEELPHRVDQARVRYWYARSLLDRATDGDAERARQMLAEARVLSEGMGLHGLINQIDALRGESGSAANEMDASGTSETTSIAVLPFVDHSADQDQAWFAAGTHEALLTAMQQITALRVTSRTSSMRYRQTTLSMPEISEELRVRWLVEGSVARAGDQIRVSAALINGADDMQVWSGQFERDVHDILGLQNEIARAIANQIQVVVTPEEEKTLSAAPRVDPLAYRAYVTGLQHFDRVTPGEFRKSVESFEKAISIDADFAPAHVALVISHGIAVEYGWQMRADAETAVRRSLDVVERLDPESGEALHARANSQFHMERDLVAAEQTYRSAVAKTSNAYVRFELGWLLSQMGRQVEAVAVLEEAVILDPRSPLIRCDLGWWLYGAREYDRAIEEAQFALELDPSFPESHWLLAAVYAQQDRIDESLAEYERYESLYGEPVLWFRGYLLGLAGRRDEAIEALENLERQEPSGGELAQIYLGLGDYDRVVHALEKAESPGVWFQPHLWPEYEALHDDPKFRAILGKFSIPLPEIST